MLKAETGEEIGPAIRIVFKYIQPVICIVCFIIAFVSEFSNPLHLSRGFLTFGWILMITPIAVALTYFVAKHC